MRVCDTCTYIDKNRCMAEQMRHTNGRGRTIGRAMNGLALLAHVVGFRPETDKDVEKAQNYLGVE